MKSEVNETIAEHNEIAFLNQSDFDIIKFVFKKER